MAGSPIRNARFPRVFTLGKGLAIVLASVCLSVTMTYAAGESPDAAVKPFDTAPWQGDFVQLLAEMSRHYANLEWAVNDRHMDLAALREATQAKLGEAKDEAEARATLEKFLDAFGDGHLEIVWPRPDANEQSSPVTPAPLCERLGYSTRDNRPGIDLSMLPQFTPLQGEDAASFPGGLLSLSHGRKVGVIRIGLFSETGFPAACEHVLQGLKLDASAECDSGCEDRVQLAVANLITATLSRRAKALRKAGATSLLVDITGNGGGSNWVEAAARVLSPKPLRESRYAFVRHPHWTDQLEERLKDVDADLAHGRGPHDVLEIAHAKLPHAIDESRKACDRDQVWQTGKLDCSSLVTGILYTSGVLDYAAPGSFPGLQSREALYNPLRFDYTESRDRLPLYVAADRNTWSAAEYFPAILQNNHAATIVGELTGGAGCGYTNGGIPTVLKNSKAVVKMPDCVRLRTDGSDEVEGIRPDIFVPWARRDTAYQRARKLFLVLDAQ